ncbi:MAG TPA: hypothetical protein VE860_00505 [Chthoniobacterales bacterium]|nr:hypothetical protein [Chthoniobacterales bacterium]
MKKPALIKVPIKLERVKRPRLFTLLIPKPGLILSVVFMLLDILLRRFPGCTVYKAIRWANFQNRRPEIARWVKATGVTVS